MLFASYIRSVSSAYLVLLQETTSLYYTKYIGALPRLRHWPTVLYHETISWHLFVSGIENVTTWISSNTKNGVSCHLSRGPLTSRRVYRVQQIRISSLFSNLGNPYISPSTLLLPRRSTDTSEVRIYHHPSLVATVHTVHVASSKCVVFEVTGKHDTCARVTCCRAAISTVSSTDINF